MQQKRKVIKRDNLPRRFPVLTTVVAWLALDHWNAAQWVCGAVGLLLLLVWIATLVHVFKYDDEEVDVFKRS